MMALGNLKQMYYEFSFGTVVVQTIFSFTIPNYGIVQPIIISSILIIGFPLVVYLIRKFKSKNNTKTSKIK